jgi:hypothetical protein
MVFKALDTVPFPRPGRKYVMVSPIGKNSGSLKIETAQVRAQAGTGNSQY